ncbi:chorismate mutase [Candidatus Acetothermia bacterium]|nr:chorismate mutase [Candidatus Acetothermia bacterium]MBI3661023.1 chorismate mutase [Candidatus Acetothermia bacterium]
MLAEWRKQIDELDKQLVRLLNERAQLALNIGKEKRTQGLPVRSAEREQNVLANVESSNVGPLDNLAIRNIFQTVINECRRLEEKSSR